MVKSQIDDASLAIASPVRRAIIERLALGPASMTDLAHVGRISLPAADKHLRLLGDAGIVHKSKAGRVTELRLAPAGLEPVEQWVRRTTLLWEGALDRLEAVLAAERSAR
jgi:DNA-binding transcriptional ArsR family regulator